jgi:hypothetical protein
VHDKVGVSEKTTRGTNVIHISPQSKARKTPGLLELEWARHTMQMQRTLARFICRALAWSSAATIGMFYMQGFHCLGFHLPDALMHWMGAVTVGEIASLSALVYGALFQATAY